uniref:RIH domain-containing protein n=1 Tax=Anopheles arabiensis TaxID=7173 RepID=A0A182I664_ANOAR
MNIIAGLISALKYTIQNNKLTSFKAIFQQICIQLSIPLNEKADIPDDYCDSIIPPLNDNLSPKKCCVLSSSNVRLPLPEYDEKDILHDGYVLEALLAYAVHEGNVFMLRYIHHKTNMTITNRLIAMILRLLPKGKNVCHKKSIPAFMYLLDHTTDLDSVDDEGRSLLLMTAQNAGATVNEQILLQQILSNNLRSIVTGIGYYGKHLKFNESSKPIANRVNIRVVDYLLNEQRVDIFSRLEELVCKTVLEFCITLDLLEVFKQFVLQINDASRIFKQEFNRFFKLAFENNAHKIIVHFIEDRDIPLSQINNIAGLISALKYTIQNNKLTTCKAIFQQICIQLSIPMNEGNDIPDDYCVPIIPLLNENIFPEVCCILSSSNVRLPLPEYDAKDILHDGYVLEALLAYSVHEGNVSMLRYIHLKANMTITNRLIAMIMRLLPKDEDVGHKKSMPAFMYLLDHTTDLDNVDDEGRNLLHMTAQNGCFDKRYIV